MAVFSSFPYVVSSVVCRRTLRLRSLPDVLDRLTRGIVLRLDHPLIRLEPPLRDDEIDHRANHVGVALFEESLLDRRPRCGPRAGRAGVHEEIVALLAKRR